MMILCTEELVSAESDGGSSRWNRGLCVRMEKAFPYESDIT